MGDRCATMCLLTTLSTFYPSFMFLFQLSMTIDIACHWLHLHTSLLQGATSHKFVDPTGNYWMHLYYTDRKVLFSMFYILAVVTFPVAVAKSGIALLQGYLAAVNLV